MEKLSHSLIALRSIYSEKKINLIIIVADTITFPLQYRNMENLNYKLALPLEEILWLIHIPKKS